MLRISQLPIFQTHLEMNQCHRRKESLENKLESIGVKDKVATKIFKNQISTLKKKKLRIVADGSTKRNSANKDTSVVISKRSINYILQKQANIIGKKKEPYD